MEKVNYWIRSAESDLDAAHALFNNGSYLQMSFFCHLAVEKCLKGCHWFRLRSEPAYTHNLIKLAKENGLFEFLSEEQKEFIAALIPLNIKGRYPDDQDIILTNLTHDEFKYILIRTEEMLAWIKKYITV